MDGKHKHYNSSVGGLLAHDSTPVHISKITNQNYRPDAQHIPNASPQLQPTHNDFQQ